MSDVQTVRPEKKATLRLGQRELSFISIAVIAIVVIALCFGLYRLFLSFRAQRDIVQSRENLLTLYKAMQRYSEDWDDRLPPADKWTDSVAGYLSAPPNTPGGPMSYLHGSGDTGAIGYVYNDLAAGYNLRPTGADDRQKDLDPGRLILLIERPGAGPNAHVRIPPETSVQAEEQIYKLLAFPHYADDAKNACTLVLYANGNIVRLTRQDFQHGG